MVIAATLSLHLLQAATRADTVVTRMIPVRGVLDWTSIILQLVVLLLGVATLVTLVMLLLAVRQGIAKVNTLVTQFSTDTRPLIAKATEVVTDAREVVAIVREDVERMSDAANAIGDQILDAADATARRVDQVNAVLDVLQSELEATAISTVAAVRGVRAGTRALTSRKRRRDRGEPPAR